MTTAQQVVIAFVFLTGLLIALAVGAMHLAALRWKVRSP